MKKGVFVLLAVVFLAGVVLAADRPDGGYAVFDGNGDYISLPSSLRSSLDNENFTINVWFRPNATGSMFAMGDSFANGDDQGIRFLFHSANGIYAVVDGAGGAVGQYASAYTTKDIWYQATLVRDYGSTVKLYVNGEEVWSKADTAGSDRGYKRSVDKRGSRFGF